MNGLICRVAAFRQVKVRDVEHGEIGLVKL